MVGHHKRNHKTVNSRGLSSDSKGICGKSCDLFIHNVVTLDLRGARYIKPAKDKMMRHHDTNHGVRNYYNTYRVIPIGRDEIFVTLV